MTLRNPKYFLLCMRPGTGRCLPGKWRRRRCGSVPGGRHRLGRSARRGLPGSWLASLSGRGRLVFWGVESGWRGKLLPSIVRSAICDSRKGDGLHAPAGRCGAVGDSRDGVDGSGARRPVSGRGFGALTGALAANRADDASLPGQSGCALVRKEVIRLGPGASFPGRSVVGMVGGGRGIGASSVRPFRSCSVQPGHGPVAAFSLRVDVAGRGPTPLALSRDPIPDGYAGRECCRRGESRTAGLGAGGRANGKGWLFDYGPC